MNLYHCSIDLVNDAKALAFANAVDQWMTYLKERETVRTWRLMRRKLHLANDSCRDFILEVEFDNMTQLDSAFRVLGEHDAKVERLYAAVSSLIAAVDVGLYRPFPDAERAERMALV